MASDEEILEMFERGWPLQVINDLCVMEQQDKQDKESEDNE